MPPTKLIPDTRVPMFEVATASNPAFKFHTVAGRYVVMCFFGSVQTEQARQVLSNFKNDNGAFDDTNACFFGVSINPADAADELLNDRLPGIRFFHDFDRNLSKLYGAVRSDDTGGDSLQYTPFSVILDERLRLIHLYPLDNPQTHAQQVLQHLANLPKLASHEAAIPSAPVLQIPRVFEPAFCNRLIDLYKTNGGEESGFMREEDGMTVAVVNHAHKRRRDYTIEEEDIKKSAMQRIFHRVVPEVEQAFQFKCTRIERYIVACYDAKDNAHFNAHRDNTTRGTAHRKFAVSINLNPDEYEGGDIFFAEYGQARYKPGLGEAVIFSCSMLHQVTPVISGTRYAFLPFLYDDAAAKLRDENLQFLNVD